MIESISGSYYDGKLSVRHECFLSIDGNHCLLLKNIDKPCISIEEVTISPRIGDSYRYIYFPDGSFFETQQNNAIDLMVDSYLPKQPLVSMKNIYRLENNLKFIGIGLVFVVLTYIGLFTYGIPEISRYIAKFLPVETSTLLASNTLNSLDERVFEESALDQNKQQELQQLFKELLPKESNFNYTLHFRAGNVIGANAFALPDGSVVMTDELIKLLDNNEIRSVMLHEIGHIVHRHSLRAVIESSIVGILYVWITDDLEAVNSLIIAIPNILLRLNYSRSMETEADSYAMEQMNKFDIPITSFASALNKLKESHTLVEQKDKHNDDDNLMDYLSTHPNIDKRIKRFKSQEEN